MSKIIVIHSCSLGWTCFIHVTGLYVTAGGCQLKGPEKLLLNLLGHKSTHQIPPTCPLDGKNIMHLFNMTLPMLSKVTGN